jgi:phosphoribosyl-ATP pyrophosphohydrolase/phosphoribosyl-AMP cyclohydrolase
VIGAMKEDREETVYEVADLAYHVLVLMNEMNISVKKVADELAKRHVVDHKVKQETMK